MAPENLIPEDPLAFIRRCVRLNKLKWTYHVNMRMKGRFISRQAILNSFEEYEIIEEYPKDKYFPSYLVYSYYQARYFMYYLLLTLKRIMFVSLLLTILIRRNGKKILKRGNKNYEMSRMWVKNAIYQY